MHNDSFTSSIYSSVHYKYMFWTLFSF